MSLTAGSEQFGLMACHGRTSEYVAWAEAGLRTIAPTPYHDVLGRSFIQSLTPSLEYLVETYREAAKKFEVKAMYFEMNGFEINPDYWHFGGFAYQEAGSIWEPDWLSEWHFENKRVVDLLGMEPVQLAFKKHFLPREGTVIPLQFEMASSIASHLICAHYIDIVFKAHNAAKAKEPKLRGLPIIATAHDWDRMAQSV
jgi:hypothetical protein